MSSRFRCAAGIIVSCTDMVMKLKWWKNAAIDPLATARGLWLETHPRRATHTHEFDVDFPTGPAPSGT